jgi:SAM-dependent methyltransferase
MIGRKLIVWNTDTLSLCDFCHNPLGEDVYIPTGTRRDIKVRVCQVCGLTQSRQGTSETKRIQTLSTDADWGNVRHGKGVRFGALRTILEREVNWDEVSHALDIGANRGDFVLWLRDAHPQVEIWAIEPDRIVVDSYAALPELHLILDRVEHVTLPVGQFDLVFCSHTLEHADSGAGMIEIMRQALRPGGLLLLEVPNLAGIQGEDIVEEFFIDKHSLHFDRETLLDYVRCAGFSIVLGAEDIDPLNITLLLRRDGERMSYHPKDGATRVLRNLQWITDYAKRLPANRLLLKRIVEEKLRPLAIRQKVGYWGAGRIFDALVNYGGLGPEDVYCLVDRHLHGIIKETHGVPIERPEMLRLREPQVLVALGRSAEDVMARNAYAFGVRHVVKFSELLGQVRDLP